MLQLAFVSYQKGAYILIEGKSNYDRFYIIQKGQVQCYRDNSGSDDGKQLLGPGDFIGVIPCMSGKPNLETVIAVTDVVCIAVRKDQYSELIANNTPVAMKIIRTFANNMRMVNEKLTKLTLKNVSVDSPEQLFEVASYYEKIGKLNVAVFGYYQYLKSCPTGVNADKAKKRFITLKPRTHAVYFEPTADLQRVYPKDTMIMCENQYGAEMFIIQSGKVKISKVVDGNEVTLAVLKPGDMFGEMALIENKPRSASAIAEDQSLLMTVNRNNFDKMVSTQPQLISRLTITLAERLWSMARQLANARLGDPVLRLLDMLSLQVEKTKMQINGNQYFTNLTLEDVANMCGIPQDIQAMYLAKLEEDADIKIKEGKIIITDCKELMSRSFYFRKSSDKITREH
ncbi:MAG: cyclic nucleotide-binding domain-containing protein [Treponema sp.]|nr:cyclic nucleotide-binding domain-containing protein [Treponema sp.]